MYYKILERVFNIYAHIYFYVFKFHHSDIDCRFLWNEDDASFYINNLINFCIFTQLHGSSLADLIQDLIKRFPVSTNNGTRTELNFE